MALGRHCFGEVGKPLRSWKYSLSWSGPWVHEGAYMEKFIKLHVILYVSYISSFKKQKNPTIPLFKKYICRKTFGMKYSKILSVARFGWQMFLTLICNCNTYASHCLHISFIFPLPFFIMREVTGGFEKGTGFSERTELSIRNWADRKGLGQLIQLWATTLPPSPAWTWLLSLSLVSMAMQLRVQTGPEKIGEWVGHMPHYKMAECTGLDQCPLPLREHAYHMREHGLPCLSFHFCLSLWIFGPTLLPPCSHGGSLEGETTVWVLLNFWLRDDDISCYVGIFALARGLDPRWLLQKGIFVPNSHLLDERVFYLVC